MIDHDPVLSGHMYYTGNPRLALLTECKAEQR